MSHPQPIQIVITGGHGGLGSQIKQKFQTNGCFTENPDRSSLDVTNLQSISTYFAHRVPDLLICNAGVIRDRPLAQLTPTDWQHTIDVNFQGARRCATACLEKMIQRGSGHIVFISSNSAIHPPVGQSAYATA